MQTQTSDSFRQRLISFWRMYEPSQLHIIDTWTSNWAGKEDELFEELVRFHGPEPHAAHRAPIVPHIVESAESQTITMCRRLLNEVVLLYAPHRLRECPRWLDSWEGNYDELLKRLQRQISIRDQLLNYFADYYPDRIDEAPGLLRAWLGQERSLFLLLNRASQEGLPGRPVSWDYPIPEQCEGRTPLPFASFRDQLYNFYRLFNPEKITEIDDILMKYEGRELHLFRKLHQKYGTPKNSDVNAESVSHAHAGETSEDSTTMRVAPHSRPAIQHLIAATSLDRTAEFDEFANSFQGSDAELAWALRAFCRRGNLSPRLKEQSRSIDEQIARLEHEVNFRRNADDAFDAVTLSAIASSNNTSRFGNEQQKLSLSLVVRSLGLGHLSQLFLAHDIDMSMLPKLTEDDLADMGIHPEQERRRIRSKLMQLPFIPSTSQSK